MGNLGKDYWDALKWLMKYLKGTSNISLMFRKNKEGVTLQWYTDSDFFGDGDNRRSTSSYFYTLCEIVISWKSQLENVVALSSIETKYTAPLML